MTFMTVIRICVHFIFIYLRTCLSFCLKPLIVTKRLLQTLRRILIDTFISIIEVVAFGIQNKLNFSHIFYMMINILHLLNQVLNIHSICINQNFGSTSFEGFSLPSPFLLLNLNFFDFPLLLFETLI